MLDDARCFGNPVHEVQQGGVGDVGVAAEAIVRSFAELNRFHVRVIAWRVAWSQRVQKNQSCVWRRPEARTIHK